MRFTKAFILLTFGVVGGVLGNLLAGYIQDDLWNNVFTSQRLAWTGVGVIVITALAAWIDARSRHSEANGNPDAQQQSVAAQGTEAKLNLHPRLDGQIFKRGETRVGHIALTTNVEAGLTASKASMTGQVDNVAMSAPGVSVKVGSSSGSRAADSAQNERPHNGT